MMYGSVINPAFYLVLQLVTGPLSAPEALLQRRTPYAIVAGNPAKFVRYRFPQETIDKLENLAWWDWDISVIKGAIPLLLSDKTDEFFTSPENESI